MNLSSSNATFSNFSDNGIVPPQHQSFTAPLTPGAADLSARRSISDSVLSGGLVTSYNQKNTFSMMVSRSGGGAVRQIIADIERRCDEQMSSPADHQVQPPESECCILAQWGSDSYYSIVIAGKQGIPAIVRAMRTFPNHHGIQECCCLALGNLCNGSYGSLIAVENAGGIRQIVDAMRNHPQSVAVQSAACDALRNTSGLIMAHAQTGSSPLVQELIVVLSHCKEMYLRPVHKNIAEVLLQSLVNIPRT
jgi:hypothetical protein